MKRIITAAFIISLFSFSKCKKEVNGISHGLPPATQEGKNTIGFLLNGKPWTPSGFDGTANLSIDVDFGFSKGIFGIAAYRIGQGINESFGIGSDSLNYMMYPITLAINSSSDAQVRFSKQPCSIDFFDRTVYRSGSLTISKLDKDDRIIAGTFTANLYRQGCDTVKITDGRFDMKF
jgi:hypothetical protein